MQMPLAFGILLVFTALHCHDLVIASEEKPNCNDVALCMGDKQAVAQEFTAVLKGFRMGDVYDNLDSWCSYQTQCLDDAKCDDKEIVSQVTFMEGVLAKMCSEKNNFRDTSSCYEGDFPEKMSECYRYKYHESPELAQKFRNCVSDVLDELPGCSRDNFFFQFFSFVFELMLKTGYPF